MQDQENIEERQLAVIAKLRKVALYQIRKTRFSTQLGKLQNTELANELFEDKFIVEKFNKLFEIENQDQAEIEFIKLCTLKIRHNLIDYMRKKLAKKRGGDVQIISLDDSLAIFSDLNIENAEIEYLSYSIEKLEKQSPYHAQLIEKKYFLGMTNKEVAEYFDISVSKVEKDSRFVITWLKKELTK